MFSQISQYYEVRRTASQSIRLSTQCYWSGEYDVDRELAARMAKLGVMPYMLPSDEELQQLAAEREGICDIVSKRVHQMKKLSYIVNEVIPNKGLSGVSKMFAMLDGEESARSPCEIVTDFTRTQKRYLRALRPCCRFHVLHRDFLVDAGIGIDACIECKLDTRIKVMVSKVQRFASMAKMIAYYGPFGDTWLDDEYYNSFDDFASMRFCGDLYKTDTITQQMVPNAPDVNLSYSLIPLALLPKFVRCDLYQWAVNNPESPVLMQLCSSRETLRLFRETVLNGRWQLFETWIEGLNPRKVIRAVELVRERWSEVREELTEFDYIARRHSRMNADLAIVRGHQKHTCRQCEEEIPKKFQWCKTHYKRRKDLVRKKKTTEESGEVQFMPKIGVDVPQPILDFLNRISADGNIDINLHGSFQKRGITWKELVAKGVLFLSTAFAAWPNKTAIAGSFLQFLTSLNIADEVMEYLMELLKSTWSVRTSFGTAQAEGGGLLDDPMTLVVTVATVIIGFFSCVFLGQRPPNGDFMTTLKNIGFAGRAVTGAETLASKIKEIVTYVADYIKHEILGCAKPDDASLIDKWCDEVATFRTTEFEMTIKNNTVLKEKIDSLLHRGDQLLKLADKLRIPIPARSRLTASYSFLMTCRSAAAYSSAGSTEPRIAPIIVHFVGATGVGKSSMLWLLMAKLLVSMGCTERNDIHEKTFFKYPTKDERWDGFTNFVKIVVCDDVFSRKDSQMNPSPEPIETIRMSNTAFWQLSMAHLSEKASTFFKAPVVLWTSNRHSFVFDSLTNSEAVERRITVRYRQKPKPQFAKAFVTSEGTEMRLDIDKISAVLEEDPTQIGQFVLFDKEVADLHTRVVLKADMTFDEMADEVIAINAENMARGGKFNEFVYEYFAKCVAEKQQADQAQQEPQPSQQEPQPSTSGTAQAGGMRPEDKERIRKMTTDWKESKTVPEFMDRIGEEIPSEIRHDWFDTETWLLRAAGWFKQEGRSRHLNILSTALNYVKFISERDGPLTKAPAPYTWTMNGQSIHLSQLTCAKIRPRIAHSFMKSWVTARARMLACPGTEEDQRLLFDDVFWTHAVIQRASIEPCDYHQDHGDTRLSLLVKIVNKMKTFRTTWREQVKLHAGRILVWEDESWVNELVVHLGLTVSLVCVMGLASWIATKLWNACCGIGTFIAGGIRLTPERIEDCFEEEKKGSPEYGSATIGRVTGPTEVTGPAEYGSSTVGRAPARGGVESVIDQNAYEYGPIMYRNLYRLQYQYNGEWHDATQLLFVRGRLAIGNSHLSLLSQHPLWRIKNIHTESDSFKLWDCRNVQCDSTSDLIMFEMPTNIPQHQSILNKFMTNADYARFTSLQQVCMYSYEPKTFAMRAHFSNDIEKTPGSGFQLMFDAKPLRVITEAVRYAIPTKAGDCGGPLIAFDNAFQRKIIGIHTAGHNSSDRFTGTGQKITQEMLKKMMSEIVLCREDSIMAPDIAKLQKKDMPVTLKDGYVEFPTAEAGFMKSGEAHTFAFQAIKSNIYPSPIHGMIRPPSTAPARLKAFIRDGLMIDPMEMARRKAAGCSKSVDAGQLESCVNDVSQMICRRARPDYDRVFAWVEAIAGVEGDEYCPGLNRRTSPGYGWPKHGVGKTTWLGIDDYNFAHPDLLAKREEMMYELKRGRRPTTVWVDTLKDERRPIDKVFLGKTRLFSVGEMTFVIVFRKYFMGFIAHMTRTRIENESCVGVNPFSYEWTALAKRLQSVGPHVIAGDFSNYDGTLNSVVLWRVLDVVNDFYADATVEERTIRSCLWSEIVNSIHITGNQLYIWNHSNPSGCPITTILNSVYHSIVARYVYLECARDQPGMYDLAVFRREVRHNNYGDDDVWNISEEIIPWFNQRTITEAFKTLGMVYTDESKSDFVVEYRCLSDVTFLKRSFRWDQDQGRYRAPISLDTIFEMPLWVRGKVDHYELTSIVLSEAVHELAQHDRKIFEDNVHLFEKARKYLSEKIPTYFETYEHYQLIEVSRWIDQIHHPKTADSTRDVLERVRERLQPLANGQIQSTLVGITMDSINTPAEEGTHDALLGTEVAEVENQQILTFSEDGMKDTFRSPSKPLLSYSQLANDSKEHTVKDFLERPIIHQDFVWRQADVRGVEKTTCHLPFDWTLVKMIREKLEGFRYVRCDFEFRLQVNAQPANSGALMVAFVPFREAMARTPIDPLQWSGYRNVILNPEQTTTVTFDVPYMHPEAYFDLVMPIQKLGDVVVMVWSQLRGGTNDVDCTLFLKAKNITVTLPTGIPLGNPPAATDKVDPNAIYKFPQLKGEVQMAKKPGVNKEAEVVAKGTVSAALNATASVADALTGVPYIGDAMPTLSWLGRALGGVAGIFGFSRPVDEKTQMPVQQSYMRTMHNFAGDSKAKTFALDMTNSIRTPKEIYQTDEDEMSISHIVKQPIAVASFLISADVIIGARVFVQQVKPGPFTSSTERVTETTKVAAYADYLSWFFEYWRGELVYNFKIFKTPFHSLRLRVSYVPGMSENDAQFDHDKSYSEVFDIRERSDFTFRVPYAYHKAWTRTFPTAGYEIPGSLVVETLNALRFPAIASDTIEFIVYKSAGDDFQFARPRTDPRIQVRSKRASGGAIHTFVPSPPYVPNPLQESGEVQAKIPVELTTEYIQSRLREREQNRHSVITCLDQVVEPDKNKQKKQKNKCKCVLMNNGEVQMMRAVEKPPLGVNPETTIAPVMLRPDTSPFIVKGMPSFDANQITWGEAVVSLLQLLKRNEVYFHDSYSYTGNAGYFDRWNPHYSYEPVEDEATATITVHGHMGWFSLLYRFQAGSVIVGLHSASPKTKTLQMWLKTSSKREDQSDDWYSRPFPYKPTADRDAERPINTPIVLTQAEESVVEYRLPHYLSVPVRITQTDIRSGIGIISDGVHYERGAHLLSDQREETYWSRCVGEDFSFGYLMPPPQCVWPAMTDNP